MTEGLSSAELLPHPVSSVPVESAPPQTPPAPQGDSSANGNNTTKPLSNPIAKAVAEALSQGLGSPWQRSVNDVLQQLIDLIHRHSLSTRVEIDEYQRIIVILQGSGQLAVNAAIEAQRDLPRILVPPGSVR